MTLFNNLQALSTAAIYAVSARCNDNESFRLENNLISAFRDEPTPVFYVDGQKGREVTVTFKGYTFTVTENFTTGQFMLTIKK